jgi:Uma2 family endonuclease
VPLPLVNVCDGMPVHVDSSLPVHPLTIVDVYEMLRVGILDEDDHIELIDGVLVEMSPQGTPHAYALRRLSVLAAPVVAAAGLELSIQAPLDIGSDISLPEPDLVIAPLATRDSHATGALLVAEMGATSLAIDLGRKADIYATAGVPDYWVLDVKRRRLVVHRDPRDDRYSSVRTLDAGATVTAVALDLAVPVSALL